MAISKTYIMLSLLSAVCLFQLTLTPAAEGRRAYQTVQESDSDETTAEVAEPVIQRVAPVVKKREKVEVKAPEPVAKAPAPATAAAPQPAVKTAYPASSLEMMEQYAKTRPVSASEQKRREKLNSNPEPTPPAPVDTNALPPALILTLQGLAALITIAVLLNFKKIVKAFSPDV